MPTTYPPVPPTLSGNLETISRFLNSPTMIARRLRTLLENRYIADVLLSQRIPVEGGAVLYETGESIFATDNPVSVPPGGEYPLTPMGEGTASIASTVKWGEDAEVTDEAIKRLAMNPVNRALIKLANRNVQYVDSVALAAIASAVTNGTAAAASWSTATAQQILTDVALARANVLALNNGYDPDTVVVDDINYAYAVAKFVAAGFFSRETNSANPAVTGELAPIVNLRWLSSPNLPTAGQALVVDSQQLGGMADEDLGGPGYASAGNGAAPAVQAKTMREDKTDKWRLRCRRVTVPIVIEPAAGRKITGL